MIPGWRFASLGLPVRVLSLVSPSNPKAQQRKIDRLEGGHPPRILYPEYTYSAELREFLRDQRALAAGPLPELTAVLEEETAPEADDSEEEAAVPVG